MSEATANCIFSTQVFYCSVACQKTDFKTHKKVCRFTASSYANNPTPTPKNALAKLRQMPAILMVSSSNLVAKVFNTAEIRIAMLSLIPAKVS